MSTSAPTMNGSSSTQAAPQARTHGPDVPARVVYDGPIAYVAHPSNDPLHENVAALVARLARRGIVARFVGAHLPRPQ